MEIIPIWWEEVFFPDDVELANKKCLYLVYNLIGSEYEILYIGVSIDSFYEIHTKKWDAEYRKSLKTIMIYQGTLYNGKNISKEKQDEKIHKVQSMLINALEYPIDVHRPRNVSVNMVQFQNLNLQGSLYSLLTSEYYWKDGLSYDIVRAVGIHLKKEPIYYGTFYGFCIDYIYFGVDDELLNGENSFPVIRLDRIDITFSAKEKIENELNVRFTSNSNYYFLPLGGMSRENLDIMIQGINLIVRKISKILEQAGVILIPTFLRKSME